MNCPDCKLPLNTNEICPNCGFDPGKCSWKIIAKVYPPDDIIVDSLLKSFGIPVKTFRKEIPQMPVSIGPLAEVAIAVPEIIAEEARALLNNSDYPV